MQSIVDLLKGQFFNENNDIKHDIIIEKLHQVEVDFSFLT